jgi:hypothetical protein
VSAGSVLNCATGALGYVRGEGIGTAYPSSLSTRRFGDGGPQGPRKRAQLGWFLVTSGKLALLFVSRTETGTDCPLFSKILNRNFGFTEMTLWTPHRLSRARIIRNLIPVRQVHNPAYFRFALLWRSRAGQHGPARLHGCVRGHRGSPRRCAGAGGAGATGFHTIMDS